MDDPTPTVDAPNKSPQRFRRTRLAVSVFFGVVTVALIVLWVRSYRTYDHLSGNVASAGVVSVMSVRGHVCIEYWTNMTFNRPWALWRGEIDKDQIEALMKINGALGFNFYTPPDCFGVVVPHWFLILLTGALAAIPWSAFSTRFSLRTMLIATTLVAALLGLAVWASR